MDIYREINYKYIPRFIPTGVSVLVRLDRPESISYGTSKVDLTSNTTSGGIILPTKEIMANAGLQSNTNCSMSATEGHETDLRIKLEGENEVTVIAIGPSAFKREGISDMLHTIKPGVRVWIKNFAGIMLKDPDGRRTLYAYVDEHQIKGLVGDIVDEF